LYLISEFTTETPDIKGEKAKIRPRTARLD